MDPLVVSVMLTADRPEMTARAIRSFEAQTYERKCLLVLDSGDTPLNLPTNIRQIYKRLLYKYPVGELRNIANAMAGCADIIAHFDSDDWSHPRRLEEQVELLCASGADVVGYNEILFWETSTEAIHDVDGIEMDTFEHSEAWIYENDALAIVRGLNPGYTEGYPAVGASFCYWRAAWERKKFLEINKGEDTDWLRRGVRCYGESAIYGDDKTKRRWYPEPRLVCELHGGNTNSSIMRGYAEFRRAPQWDEYCAERMLTKVAK